MNFKVIDDNINEIDHSHQNVDITKGQSELSHLKPLHGSVSSVPETKVH